MSGPSSPPAISSNNGAVSQPVQDIGTRNPMVALSLASSISTIPAMPVALRVPGINAMPIATCAVNAQQHNLGAGNTPAPAQALQTNNGGGSIIVLNVANGNNLAATLSQLVSGGLIQQAPTQIPIVHASSVASVSHTVTSSTVSTVTQGSSTNTSHTVTVPAMKSHSSNMIAPQMTEPNIAVNKHMPFPVPTQQIQPQQSAAFMLVPIPQLPAVQNSQTNMASGFASQQQQQVLVNLPNQMVGTYPPQAQNNQIGNHHREQAMHQMVNASAVPCSQLPPTLPKTDELRAFMTQSASSNSHTSCSMQSANQIHAGPNSYPSHSNPSDQTVSVQSHLHCSVPVDQHNHVPLSQCQPTVSSPGLAFLAQVSSLTSSNNGDSVASVDPYSTDSSTVFHTNYQSLTNAEVNNNSLPVLPLNDVKKGAPMADGCTTPGPMTVSSTTKLGDDSVPDLIMQQQTSSRTPDILLQDISEPGQFHLCEDVQSPVKIGVKEKRKKDPPLPPPIKEKKKKGPAPKLAGDEVCLICGDRASGFHYNTLSCEGCKGFFRRTVIKAAKYQCKQNGDCTMDLYMRRKCQKCRFEKCKAVGMREESVLSEEKVKAKKLKKECEVAMIPVRLIEDISCPKLTPQQRSLIELLEANERRFQWPTNEDVEKVTVWVEGDDTPHSRQLRFAHFTEMCILIVQLVVEFTKQLPGFLTVLREDQIVLLKACAIEVMLLRAAKQYNKHDGTINFLNGKLYDKTSFYRAGMQVEFVDPIFQFCNSMAQLDLDDTEYAILVAINTFSTDRPHIKDIEKVEHMQDPYVDLLRVYSRIRHPDDPLMFARILMKIVELRTLNNYHSEQIFALKVQDRKLPPLLAEIWDM